MIPRNSKPFRPPASAFLRVFFFLFAVLLVLLDAPRAERFNAKTILIGDKGAALGGAFAGLADDATASFYNPAGLAHLERMRLNVSAQIAQYDRQEIRVHESRFLPYASFNISPSISAFSQRLGPFAYAFSLVTPQNELFRGERSLGGAGADSAGRPLYGEVRFDYSDVAKTHLAGPSLAFRLSPALSFGATVYGIYHTRLETTYFGQYRAEVGPGGKPRRYFEQVLRRTLDRTGTGITGSVGALWRSRAFGMGVVLRPGGRTWIDLTDEQGLELFANQAPFPGAGAADSGGPVPTEAVIYHVKEGARQVERLPVELSLGFARAVGEGWTYSLQADFIAASASSYPSLTLEENPEAESGFDQFRPAERRFTVRKKPVLNLSAGLDWRFAKTHSLAGGVYTDLAQGPYDDRPQSWNKRVDYFGLSLSYAMEKPFSDSRFGMNGAWGNGSISHFRILDSPQGPQILTDGQGNAARPRESFDALLLGLFMSTTLKI